MNDTQTASSMLRVLASIDEESIVCFTFKGEPKSKRNKWSDANHGKELIRLFRSEIPHGFSKSVAIAAIFYRPNYQRIDVDNMMKMVMDSGTRAGVWRDDSYVIAEGCRVELDHHHPRIVIAVCSASTSFDRDYCFICKVCGKAFRRPGKATFKNPPSTCSRSCRFVLYAKDRGSARCPKCSVEFVRRIAGQKYCSRRCSDSRPRVRLSSSNQRPWPKCIICGERVSRREYLRCWKCSPKGRRAGSKNKTP